MNIPLNTQVKCTDGRCGRSTFVIVDPTTQTVTHFVVKEHQFPFAERLMPVEQIAETTADEIRLRCSKEELAKFQPFVETHYRHVEIPDYENVPVMMWPYAFPMTERWAALEDEAIPPGELAVHRGAAVHATDGTVGLVDEFLVDPKTMHISHLVVRKGHLWRQREITIPVAQVNNFGEETVYLKLDKKAVEALPKVPIHRQYGADTLSQIVAKSDEVDEWVAAWKAERAEARQTLYAEVEKTFQAWDAEMKTVQAQIDEVGAESSAELDKQIIALRDEQNAARAKFYHDLNEQLQQRQAEIDGLEAEAAQATAEVQSQISEQINTLRTQRAAAWQELQLTLTTQIEELRSQLQDLESRAAVATAGASAEVDQQIGQVRAQLSAARQKFQQAAKAQIAEVEAELGELQVQAALAGMDARDDLDELSANMRARRHMLHWQLIHLIQDRIQPIEAELDDMQVQLALAEMDTRDAVAERNAELRSEYHALRGELIHTIEAQVQELEAEICNVQAQASHARADAQDAYDQLLNSLRARRVALRQKLTLAIKAQQQAWNAEIRRLQAEMEKLEAEAQAEVAQRVAALQTNWSAMQAKLLDNLTVQLRQVNAEIETLESRAATAGSDARATFEQRRTTLRSRRDAILAELQANVALQLHAWDAEIDELQGELSSASTETKKRIEARIESLRTKRDTTGAKMQEQMQAQLQVVQGDIKEAEAQAAQSRAGAKAELSEQAHRLRDKWRTTWERLEHSMTDDIDAMDETLTVIMEGVEALALDERAENERRAIAQKARRDAAQAHLQDLRHSNAATRRDIAEGVDEAKADMHEAVQQAKAEYAE